MASAMKGKTVQVTKDHSLFQIHRGENRPLNLKKHRKLEDSMKRYGFIPEFPIVVSRVRGKNGHMIVKDGQHRLAMAQRLKLPVYWIEESVDFDVAVVNMGQKPWQPRDYAERWAAGGRKAYRDGLDFAEQHKLPVGIAFALLAGTVNYSNVQEQFIDGTFKIKDRQWADAVVEIYGPFVAMAPVLKKETFLLACMRVCRVPGFDAARLIRGAEMCRERLVSYGTTEAYLDMLEECYNFHRKHLVGLKVEATMAMRERNNATKTKEVEPSTNGTHHLNGVKSPKAKTNGVLAVA
jgi:hypothetical protein